MTCPKCNSPARSTGTSYRCTACGHFFKRVFELKRGKEARDIGIKQAIAGGSSILGDAVLQGRKVARQIAMSRPDRRLTIDSVRHALERDHQMVLGLNASGVWAGNCFKVVGRVRTSRITSHARWISVWQYYPELDKMSNAENTV